MWQSMCITLRKKEMGKRFEDFRTVLESIFEDDSECSDNSGAIQEAVPNRKMDKKYRWFFVHLFLTLVMFMAMEFVLVQNIPEEIAYSTWYNRFRDPVLILVSFAFCYIIVRGLIRVNARIRRNATSTL